MQNIASRQALTPVILTMALASAGWYLTMTLAPRNIGHPVAYGLLLLADLIGLSQLIFIWITVLVGPPKDVPYEVVAIKNALRKNPHLAGNVAVLVPVAGEPEEIVRETLKAAHAIKFPHQTYLLDDSASDVMANLAREIGTGYVRRKDRVGWKAGNLNNALGQIKCDYFAIFDSDHVAHPAFLHETLPYLLADPKVAFVQTPQYLTNRDDFVGGGVAETQEAFYRHIQVAKNKFNAAFCVGTNVVFRMKAVKEVGGMYAKSNSEDVWTSILLHERGWKSVYLPIVLAAGLAPDTIESYFKQQFRWARGGYEILFTKNPLLNKGLTLDQKMQYLFTALYFTSGFSACIFFLLPLMYVYFGWKPITVEGGFTEWAWHFIPYFALMYGSIAHLTGKWPRWRTYVVAMGAFPAQISACFAVATGMRIRWSASGAVRTNLDFIKAVMPHLLILLLSLGAIPLLFLHVSRDGAIMAPIMTVWLLLNSAILFSICKRAIPPSVRVHEPARLPVSIPVPA